MQLNGKYLSLKLIKLILEINVKITVKKHHNIHPISLIANNQKHLENQFCQQLANNLNLKYQNPINLKLPVEAFSLLPNNFIKYWQIIILKIEQDNLLIGHCQPFILNWLSHIKYLFPNKKIKLILISPWFLIEKLKLSNNLSQSIIQATNDYQISKGINHMNNKLIHGKKDLQDIIDWVLQESIKSKASDIHFEPKKEKILIRFRIDDVLTNFTKLPLNLLNPIINRFKIISGMNISEKRKPQDGNFSYNYDNKKQEYRISSIPIIEGEKIVLRLFNKATIFSNINNIGMNENHLAQWLQSMNKSTGLILICGPTGSGKTTTLYSSLNYIATGDKNITTIEDPVEVEIEKFNQIQINPKIGFDFANALRSVLRQDPNIIMVGEIRDKETADIATRSSLTGHLVLSTIHTNDSPSAIIRLLDLGIKPYLIKSSLINILSQRLIRKLCNHCKQPTEIKINNQKINSFKKIGCYECYNTGYYGRTVIFQQMLINNEIKEKINNNLNIKELNEILNKNGVKNLYQSGLNLVKKGITSFDELTRVCD